MAQVLLDKHKSSVMFQEHALEGEMTHWMQVDWTSALTSRAACHCLLQQHWCLVATLKHNIMNILTWLY